MKIPAMLWLCAMMTLSLVPPLALGVPLVALGDDQPQTTDTQSSTTTTDTTTTTTTKKKAKTGAETKSKRPLTPDERKEREGQTKFREESASDGTGCPKDVHATPKFLRTDLAYSTTGVDCFGDAPSGYTVAVNLPQGTRAPASAEDLAMRSCEFEDKHSHPVWLRSDLEYSVLGRDCQGDAPSSAPSK